MIELIRYTSDKKPTWDQFVTEIKNNHFFFQRDYMDYHQDRFIDHSCMFYDDKTLIAVLPATEHEQTLISHGGLTFGGLLINKKMKTSVILDIFTVLIEYLKQHHFKKLYYKAIPYIYHEIPAEEDLYALFINNASLTRRDVSSTINLQNKIGFSGGKKNGVAKAKKHGLTIGDCENYQNFFEILNTILTTRHNTRSTHTAEELSLLVKKFPANIKFHAAFLNGEITAGVIMYNTHHVAHTQYMATTEIGRETGALDFLLDHLINNIYADKKYFNFGVSTEQQGRYLNQGLIAQKEMFGARSVMYDTYELIL